MKTIFAGVRNNGRETVAVFHTYSRGDLLYTCEYNEVELGATVRRLHEINRRTDRSISVNDENAAIRAIQAHNLAGIGGLASA
jgi:hypothetical protein